jgi:hypothetical protein
MSGYGAQQISYNVWYETSRKIKRSSAIGMGCSISLGELVKVKVSANDRSQRASFRAASVRSQENQQEKLPDSAQNYWYSFGILMLRVPTFATSKEVCCTVCCSVPSPLEERELLQNKTKKLLLSQHFLSRKLYKWLAATARQLL